MMRKCAQVILLGAVFSLTAYAEDPPNRDAVVSQLKVVRMRIEQEQGALDALKKEQKAIEKSVGALDKESLGLAQQERQTLESLNRLEKDIRSSQQAQQETAARMKTQREQLNKRIVAVYKMQRRTAALDYLFRADSSTDLLKRADYLAAVARYDKDALQEMGRINAELKEKEDKLAALKTERAKELERVRTVRTDLQNRKLEKAKLLRDAENKRKMQERMLGKLSQSAAKLEGVLASLMGSEEAPPPETEPAQPETEPQPPVAPYDGSGLGGLRGKLPLPVAGKVIQRFGKQRHEEFSDMLFVKGLEFSAESGANVRPVAKGRVIFTQFLPGFGNIVIIDHGERYYTLYGRLASMLCKQGDDLTKDDVVGVLGEPDNRGRNFYFELRQKGKAIDPIGFFSQRPGLAGA